MANPLWTSDRSFQIWNYDVSHSVLVLRSPISPGSAGTPPTQTNLDIIIRGTDFIRLPTLFTGLRIDVEESTDTAYKFVFQTANQQHSVCGAHLRIYENALDNFDYYATMRDDYKPGNLLVQWPPGPARMLL